MNLCFLAAWCAHQKNTKMHYALILRVNWRFITIFAIHWCLFTENCTILDISAYFMWI